MSRFCVAPWVGLSTDVNGSIRPCCRFEQPTPSNKFQMPWMKNDTLDKLYNGSEMKALRKAFLEGKEPEECKICWDEEQSGIKSFRQRYSEDWDWSDEKFDLETKAIPKLLDFKLSNVCNLKCRMCGPQASSSIAKEEGNLNPYHLSDKILGTENEKIFFDEILPKTKYLELTGGEPFFSPENKRLLEMVCETEYVKNISLKITTNGMFYVPKLMDKIKAFGYVGIAISLDDVGERLQYARGNSNWQKIEKNVLAMKNNYPDFAIVIYRTINNFNIYHLDELDEWGNKNSIYVSNGLLHTPEYLSIQYLPKYVKDEVEEKLGHIEKYKKIFDFMNVKKEHKLLEFRKKTNRLDKIRNELFEESYPEWSEMLLW